MRLKKVGYDITSRIIGEDNLEKLAFKYLNLRPGFKPQRTQQSYTESLKRQMDRTQPLVPQLFSAYYGTLDPKEIIPDIDTLAGAAFVPYCRGTTNLLIHNFFKHNYGVRDPILMRISIMAGDKHFWSKQILLAPDEVRYLRDFVKETGEDALPKHGSLILEAFYPRVKTPNNELRFFAIYRNEEKGTVAGVHSTFLPLKPYQNRSQFGTRAYVPPQIPAYYCTVVEPYQRFTSCDIKTDKVFVRAEPEHPGKGYSGFCIMTDPEGNPTSVWHDILGKSICSLREPKGNIKNSHPCLTGLFVPDFKTHAPILFINKDEVGFQPETLTISAHKESGELICERKVPFTAEDGSLDLAKVFAEDAIEGAVFFIINFNRYHEEFTKEANCYLNAFYRCNDKLADQVHTHNSYGYKNDPHPKTKSYRCSKMAPLFKNLKCFYSIVTAGGVRVNPDDKIKLRVLTDTGTEHIFNNYPLLSDGVAVIHGDRLLEEIGSHVDQVAVVWFEHQTTNFNGSWMAIDRKSGHIAVDHFTGA